MERRARPHPDHRKPSHFRLRQFPNNGNFVVTKTGGGVWITSGSGDNGSVGAIINGGAVMLNKTSSSGAHAIGGPGLTINNSGMAKITGTGGDQIYDGATVTLAAGGVLDLNGRSETVGGLSGVGGRRGQHRRRNSGHADL